MAFYLDSAITAEAEIVKHWGWVTGITTNPTLLAQANTPPETTLKTLVSLTSGPVYYQLLASNQQKMIAEGRKAFEIIGSQTILKIPATPLGFEVVAILSSEITCSVTGIYSPAQAAVAKEAGAKIAIAYVNRAERLLGDGIALVRDMAIRGYLYRLAESLSDNKVWIRNKLTNWDNFRLKILNKIL